MNNHLPECPRSSIPDKYADAAAKIGIHAGDCICSALRAREQRVREDERDNCWSAVAELIPTEFWANVPGLRDQWWIVKADALAAIDDLKEKP